MKLEKLLNNQSEYSNLRPWRVSTRETLAVDATVRFRVKTLAIFLQAF